MNDITWDQFWRSQKKSFHEVMEIATSFFVSRLADRFHFDSQTTIFDYGCGPGFLADCLAKKNIRVTGADINQLFIKECEQKHPSLLFIPITTKSVENRRILAERLGDSKFDFIILLSISQYLKDSQELNGIIRLVQQFASSTGKIILADVVDERTSSVSDAMALLRECIRKHRLLSFLRFVLYVRFSSYSAIAKKTSLLHLPERSIREIADQNFLEVEKVDGLTLHPSRTSYIFTKIPGEGQL